MNDAVQRDDLVLVPADLRRFVGVFHHKGRPIVLDRHTPVEDLLTVIEHLMQESMLRRDAP